MAYYRVDADWRDVDWPDIRIRRLLTRGFYMPGSNRTHVVGRVRTGWDSDQDRIIFKTTQYLGIEMAAVGPACNSMDLKTLVPAALASYDFDRAARWRKRSDGGYSSWRYYGTPAAPCRLCEEAVRKEGGFPYLAGEKLILEAIRAVDERHERYRRG